MNFSLGYQLCLLFVFIPCIHFAQNQCLTVEVDQLIQNRQHTKATQDFETWLAPLVEKQKRAQNAQRDAAEIPRLPVVFHLIHDGPDDEANLPAFLIEAQIAQLNHDFRKAVGTSGYNDHPSGADVEVEFFLADIDPFGNLMAEPGINRIDRNARGWTAPPYIEMPNMQMDVSYVQGTIKAGTQWNPERYINVWVMSLHHKVLGFAQSPSASGLEGLEHDPFAEIAETDGIVISYHTVGSTDMPNPFPHPKSGYHSTNMGRTLSHEMGHFFGLRHIWGDRLPTDTECQTDYCDDTPFQIGPSNPSKPCEEIATCDGSRDMVENYMDYSSDACVNVFTQDQKARMQAVLANSPRRNVSLTGAPNLVVQDVNIPVTGQSGETVLISFDIANTGDADAGAFNYSIAWTDVPLSTGEVPPVDQVLFNDAVEGLDAGGVLSIGNVPVILPNPIVRGGPDGEDDEPEETTIFIHILIDQPVGNQASGPGNVAETNEQDNVASSPIILSSPQNGRYGHSADTLSFFQGGSVIAYPNPLGESLKIERGKAWGGTISLRLNDMQGRLLWEKEMPESRQRIEVDMENLLPGIYLLHAASQTGKQEMIKLVKY